MKPKHRKTLATKLPKLNACEAAAMEVITRLELKDQAMLMRYICLHVPTDSPLFQHWVLYTSAYIKG